MMEKYRQFVSDLAQNDVNEIFMNTDADHALEVFVNIFNNSKTEVRILAGSLSSSLANKPEYIAALSQFIERGGKLFILLNDYKEHKAKESNLLKRLAFYILQGKPIIIATTDIKPFFTDDKEKNGVHFTVGDGKSFRIETHTENRSAICNFNDSSMGSNLVKLYEKISQSSKSFDLIKLFNIDANGTSK